MTNDPVLKAIDFALWREEEVKVVCNIDTTAYTVEASIKGANHRIEAIRIAYLASKQQPSDGGEFDRVAMRITAELWAPLQFNPDFRAPEGARYIVELTSAHNADRAADKQRIAEFEEQNLNMMALFRDFYELEFNRDECWEIIKKYGGDA